MTDFKSNLGCIYTMLPHLANIRDLNDVCFVIQDMLSQPYGDVAGAVFNHDWRLAWADLPLQLRLAALRCYVDTEATLLGHALPYAPHDLPDLPPRETRMSQIERQAIESLRHKGYAVACWSPDDLDGFPADELMTRVRITAADALWSSSCVRRSTTRYILEYHPGSTWLPFRPFSECPPESYLSQQEAEEVLNTYLDGLTAGGHPYNPKRYRVTKKEPSHG